MKGWTIPFSFLALRDSYEESKYVILCVPYDSTESWIAGTRLGPLAIIEASRYIDTYDIELKSFVNNRGIHTIFELPVSGKPERMMMELVESSVKKLLDDHKIPVIIGGEHTVSLPALRALKDEVRLAIVLDAHPDLYEEYEGRKICHATVCRRMSELVGELIILGVRTMSYEEKKILEKSNNIEVINKSDIPNEIDKIENLIKGEKIYLSVDVDVLDPTNVPCVGNPEPDGLSYKEALEVIKRVIEAGDVRGMDFVEFVPCQGMRSDAYLVARLIQKTIGYHSLHSRD